MSSLYSTESTIMVWNDLIIILAVYCSPNAYLINEILEQYLSPLGHHFIISGLRREFVPIQTWRLHISQKPAARLRNPNDDCSRSSNERVETFAEYLSTVFNSHALVNTRHEEYVNTSLNIRSKWHSQVLELTPKKWSLLLNH